MKVLRAIGLMSGTSLDGVDAALLRTDGNNHIEREGFVFTPYPPALRDSIRACFGILPQQREQARDVEVALTEIHAAAVQQLLSRVKLSAGDVDLIGFHGQTISHSPKDGYTLQIGDGALLAQRTGIQVINDFRTADVAAGGQGAPLVPVYHQALAHGMEKPVVFLNIGGVANVTYIGNNDTLLAFDTGAGNALMDDWMLTHTGIPCDTDGAAAQRGTVAPVILEELLSHPFFDQEPPKSLDRNAFVSPLWKNLSLEDGAATLSAFTVGGIVQSLSFFEAPPAQWIVCGGGRLNHYLMQELARHLRVPVHPIEHYGLNGDAIEAEAFAYLAARSYYGLPLSFPTTTGVPHPMTGGTLHAPLDT